MFRFLLFLCLTSSGLFAQIVYPVEIQIHHQKPLSLLIDQWASYQQWQIELKLMDLQISQHPVRVRIELEDSDTRYSVSNTVQLPRILLFSNSSYLLTQQELSAFFAENNNLSGKPALYQKRVLPGWYKLHVSVYDDVHMSPLSLEKSIAFFIEEKTAPLLVAPENEQTIEVSENGILFIWNGASNAYEFELKEWKSWEGSPENAFANYQPSFKKLVAGKKYFLALGDFPIETNKKYLWRVREIHPQGLEVYASMGYSNTFEFRAQKKCASPSIKELVALSSTEAKIQIEPDQWENTSNIQIRKSSNTIWQSIVLSTNPFSIKGLEENTTYEIIAQNTCYDQRVLSGKTHNLTTPETDKRELRCDQQKKTKNYLEDPLLAASAGDEWTIGNFKIKLLSVQGGNGIYSGTCKIPGPILNAHLKGYFTNVQVNKNKEIYKGVITLVSGKIELIPDEYRQAFLAYSQQITNGLQQVNPLSNSIGNGTSGSSSGINLTSGNKTNSSVSSGSANNNSTASNVSSQINSSLGIASSTNGQSSVTLSYGNANFLDIKKWIFTLLQSKWDTLLPKLEKFEAIEVNKDSLLEKKREVFNKDPMNIDMEQASLFADTTIQNMEEARVVAIDFNTTDTSHILTSKSKMNTGESMPAEESEIQILETSKSMGEMVELKNELLNVQFEASLLRPIIGKLRLYLFDDVELDWLVLKLTEQLLSINIDFNKIKSDPMKILMPLVEKILKE